MSEGGRWFWADSFNSDAGAVVGAAERIWAYVLRNYPVDPARVCVAGEGEGATLVASIALLGERMSHRALAFRPRQYSQMKDFPLPLPEYNEGSEREVSLRVIGSEEDDAWWSEELDAYRDVGMDTNFSASIEDLAQRDRRQEQMLREAMNAGAATDMVEAAPRHMVVPADSARARHWTRLYALRHSAETGETVTPIQPDATLRPDSEELIANIDPNTIGDALPPCPGPFGGTTILVLPENTTKADTQAWIAIEENDPLNKESRFHRVQIALSGADAGERALPQLMAKLEGEGRKNLLIVPAVFYADAATMHSLERLTRASADRMTLQWLPGLGGGKLPLSIIDADAPLPPVAHELRVNLDPTTHRLSVVDSMALPAILREAGTSFTLNSALEVTSSTPAIEKTQDEDEDGNAHYELLAAAEDGLLQLSYDGEMNFGLSDQKEEYSRGMRDTRGILGPEGVYLDAGSNWVAQFGDEMLRFTVEIESPADWHVISQGNGRSDMEDAADGRSRAQWDSGAELEQVYLVGGPLSVARETAGAVEILVYLHESDDALTRRYLDATARYIEMYRQFIGPYPYEKFALVENFWETGYGMPSFTLLGEQIIRFPFILHSSYPHEILHNWWGNSVFVDYESGNWCEGLTAYMADHLIQEQRGLGTEYRRGTLQKYRDHVKEGRDFPLREFRSRHSAATEAVGYGKALMTYHMLRRKIGDDHFRRAMVDFYRSQRGSRASFDDLREVFESTTDEDYGAFFEQWVDRTGAPQLSVHDVEVDESGELFTVRGRLEQSQDGDAYDIDVPMIIATAEGEENFDVAMQSKSVEFSFDFEARPMTLAVDPLFDLFRQLDPLETPSSIGQIFGEPSILAILPSGERGDAYRELVEAWATDDHAIEVVRDADIDELPSDRAVWLLGRNNRFAGSLLAFDANADVSTAAATLQLGADVASIDGNCTVVIRRHPNNVEKAVGWICVDNAAAFEGLGRKLPHYGKYSFVAFEGDEPSNNIKGQWEATDSPLVIALSDGTPLPIVGEERSALAELPPVFSQHQLGAHVDWLAAPERRGRGLASPELDETADYIAAAFEAAGLVPGGDDGGWFQSFEVAEGPDGSPVRAKNVIAILPGNREEWSEQSIVLGAHYDHLGTGWPDARSGNEGKIHPGADDNASGVAVLLELARDLAAAEGASRNLVIIAFSAEEAGLLGSRHYVEHPNYPLEHIRGVINMDTVGRLHDGKISVHATGTADEWQHIFRGVGFVSGIQSKNIAGRVGGSDQDSFIDAGVPAVQIFSGANEDYHRPTDSAELVDRAGLVKVATFVKEALVYMLEREAPMNVRIEGTRPVSEEAASQTSGRRVSFGTVPDFEFAGPGVKVDSVVEGSPAEAGGVLAGDIVLRIDQAVIKDLRNFSEILSTLEPEQEVDALILRDGQGLTLKVRVVAR
jgi:hypothetical protein